MRGRDLIQKYIKDGLTADERFELEKIALDDDFVADAWEGVQGVKKENIQNSLARLEKKIEPKSEARVIPMYRKLMPYAAAAAIGALLLMVVFNPTQIKETPQSEKIVVLDILEDNEKIGETGLTISNQPTEDESIAEPNLNNSEAEALDRPASTIKENLYEKPDDLNAERKAVMSGLEKPQKNSVIVQEDASVQEVTSLESDALHNEEAGVVLNLGTEQQLAQEAVLEYSDDEEQSTSTDQKKSAPKLRFRKSEILDADQNIALTKKASSKESTIIVSKSNLVPVNTDTLVPHPKIGFESYKKELSKNNTVKKEDLFMYGIKEGYLLEVKFTVEGDGLPKDITIKNLSRGSIYNAVIEQFRNSGPWTNPGKEKVLYFLELRGI